LGCVICKNGTTIKVFVNVPIVREGAIIFIKNIPGEIGNNCGEYYIDSNVVKGIYTKEDDRMNQGVEMEVTQHSPVI
jgi:YgiT-type zinc finger domain-containing protein